MLLPLRLNLAPTQSAAHGGGRAYVLDDIRAVLRALRVAPDREAERELETATAQARQAEPSPASTAVLEAVEPYRKPQKIAPEVIPVAESSIDWYSFAQDVAAIERYLAAYGAFLAAETMRRADEEMAVLLMMAAAA